MTSRLTRRLSAQDAAFLYWERSAASLHIGSLGVYEGRIPFDRFVEQLDARMPRLPRYRQRVMFVPFSLAQPTWEDDPDFQVRHHVHRVSLPPPGNEQQLADLAAELFAQPLDRAKPLWEMFVIDGLEDRRTGILSKVHHCLVDGVSGIELLMVILDLSPDPVPEPDPAPWAPGPLPEPGAMMVDAFWAGLGQQLEMLHEFQEALIDPRPRLQQTQDILRALSQAAPPSAQSRTRPLFAAQLRPERRVAFSEMSFVEIREIRASLGGTVNDVVLAILAGTLRRYLVLHDHRIDGFEPRVVIPVNIRVEGEEGGLGNRISCMITSLPIDEADAAARLRVIHERVDLLKQTNQAGGLELLTRLAARAPVPVQALAAQAPAGNAPVDLICTNVPGPMIPLYSVGHLMLAHYPMVPLSFDMGLAVGVTSYNQRLYFGLMADPKALPDLARLKQCLDESFLELRNAAGVAAFDLPAFKGQPGQNGGAEVAQQPAQARPARKKTPRSGAQRR